MRHIQTQLVTADRYIAPKNFSDLLYIFVNLSQKVNEAMGYVTSRTSFPTYWNSGTNQKAACVLNFLIQNTDIYSCLALHPQLLCMYVKRILKF